MDSFPPVLIASGLLSFVFVAILKDYFSRYLLDIPNHRSSHSQPTPRGGGLGFVIAFAIGCGLLSYFDPQRLPFWFTLKVWAVLLPLAIVGIIDDYANLSSKIRYLVQLSTAGIAVYCFGAFPQPWFSRLGTVGIIAAIALTVIGMTALINFYNFLDGLDGLVAGVSAVQFTFLAFELHQPIFMLLVVALLGFLWWNWSPAKIFMGDVGSTVLGATVAIALLNHPGQPIQAWSALMITLPLVADAIYTLMRRLMRKENIFQPHRTHLYQRLQQSGWSHQQVAGSYILMTIAIALALHFWGAIGAGISITSVVGTIVITERYLTHRRGAKMRTVIYTFVKNSLAGLRTS